MHLRNRIIDVTMTTDTAAYANGDLIADTQEIANFFRDKGVPAKLQSLTVIDPDDQGAAFTVVFSQASTSFGSENSAPNIADADALNVLGQVTLTASDYVDIGGAKVGTLRDLNLVLAPVDNTTKSLYAAIVITTGTPTFAGGAIKLRLGVEYD